MADTKLTALTETTSPAISDDVYIVTTPGGTPASKRCTIANLKTAMGVITPAMVRIAQTVVGVGGVASVTFSGIAGTYENLILTITGRGSKVANNIDVYVQFNADTGNNYDTDYINHQGTTITGGDIRGGAGCLIGEISAASATANYAGGIRTCFYGYARSVFYKPFTAQSFTIWSTGANTQNYFQCAGMWRNTAAITAIKVYPDANDFVQDTVLTLYGES